LGLRISISSGMDDHATYIYNISSYPELPKCPVKLARSRKYMIHRKYPFHLTPEKIQNGYGLYVYTPVEPLRYPPTATVSEARTFIHISWRN
jgi:hypothetical protein